MRRTWHTLLHHSEHWVYYIWLDFGWTTLSFSQETTLGVLTIETLWKAGYQETDQSPGPAIPVCDLTDLSAGCTPTFLIIPKVVLTLGTLRGSEQMHRPKQQPPKKTNIYCSLPPIGKLCLYKSFVIFKANCLKQDSIPPNINSTDN